MKLTYMKIIKNNYKIFSLFAICIILFLNGLNLRPGHIKPTNYEKEVFSNQEYIFIFSTGHTGTTTFAPGPLDGGITWAKGDLMDDMLIRHEYEIHESLKLWYAQHTGRFKYRYHFYKKDIIPSLQRILYFNRKRIFYDGGHHVIFDWMEPFLDSIGIDKIKVIRLRRSRYTTARSFDTEGRQICSRKFCEFCLCPLLMPNDMILSPPEGVWEKLTSIQKYYWFVDEVEARWQALLRKYEPKGLKYVEVSWGDLKDMKLKTKHFKPVADFIGLDIKESTVNETKRCHYCVSDAEKRLKTQFIEYTRLDEEYQSLMKYSEYQKKLLKKVLF